ncbi:MAG: zinc ribbon domain-containing protein [Deltaproteobacteria bacterium]|nr:zinc ribbon domain-containing protein [Deltaproteobacteria bacterium]
MPIYEYECTECGHQTEAIQKFSDPPLTECGECRGRLRKLISQNSFHLKGSGWYVTDYASKTSANFRGNKKDNSKGKMDSPKAEASSSADSSGKNNSSSDTAE